VHLESTRGAGGGAGHKPPVKALLSGEELPLLLLLKTKYQKIYLKKILEGLIR
jgi:hypothetical protein